MFLNISDFLVYDFLLRAMISSILLSLSAGFISPFILAKRYSFIGPAISHSTLLGISIALSFLNYSSSYELFLATLFITLILTSFLAYTTLKQRLPSDSMIGVFFTTTMSLGILIQSLSKSTQTDLLGLLFGNIFLANNQDLIISGILFIIIVLGIFLPFKKWIYQITDMEGAEISGIKTTFYHYFFFVLLTLLIISSIKLAGSILINALILIPGMTALRLSSNIKSVFIISSLFSVLTTILGLILSNYLNLQSGAIISVLQFSSMLLLIGIKKLSTRS